MRRREFTTSLIAGAAMVLSGATGAAHADLGDQLAKLLADDGAENDQFAVSVAISGATGNQVAIVGALRDDDNGDNSGSAYLFDISDPKNPVQITKLLPDDGAAVDNFGGSVAISGTTAILGAYGNNATGSAYLFDTTTGAQITKLLPEDGASLDRFGISVSISEVAGQEVAIVGAYWDDDNGDNSGSAYIFDAGAAAGKCPWDLDDSADVGTGDLLILLGWWGFDPLGPPDFDGDGAVGTSDLIILLGNWGPCE